MIDRPCSTFGVNLPDYGSESVIFNVHNTKCLWSYFMPIYWFWHDWSGLPHATTHIDGHACLKAMCFYWLWDGPLFISVVTEKTVSWDWIAFFNICTVLAIATATVKSIYILRSIETYGCSEKQTEEGKTFGGHYDSRLSHVNSSAPIIRGVNCFAVSKLQH